MSDSTLHDQLSAYLDGELSHAEAAEIAQRLQADPALRAELEAVRGAVSLLRTHGP
jgi:anti-sigma factor RsiW